MSKTHIRSAWVPWWIRPYNPEQPWKIHRFNLKTYRVFANRKLRRAQDRELRRYGEIFTSHGISHFLEEAKWQEIEMRVRPNRECEIITPRKSTVLWEAF